MRRILFACAAVVPALVAGCTPAAQPTPGATPVPTVAAPTLQLMCTPEEGGTAAPCTQAEYDAMVARDKLYEEAKVVLTKYNEEFERLSREGSPASPEILALTSGGYTQMLQEEMSQGFTFDGGEFNTVGIKRWVGPSESGSVLALETCTDSSSITIRQGGKELGKGRVAEERYYFAGTPGSLKIVDGMYEVVESC